MTPLCSCEHPQPNADNTICIACNQWLRADRPAPDPSVLKPRHRTELHFKCECKCKTPMPIPLELEAGEESHGVLHSCKLCLEDLNTDNQGLPYRRFPGDLETLEQLHGRQVLEQVHADDATIAKILDALPPAEKERLVKLPDRKFRPIARRLMDEYHFAQLPLEEQMRGMGPNARRRHLTRLGIDHRTYNGEAHPLELNAAGDHISFRRCLDETIEVVAAEPPLEQQARFYSENDVTAVEILEANQIRAEAEGTRLLRPRVCSNCGGSRYREVEVMGEISHEMAIDACDRSLEGMPIVIGTEQIPCELCHGSGEEP